MFTFAMSQPEQQLSVAPETPSNGLSKKARQKERNTIRQRKRRQNNSAKKQGLQGQQAQNKQPQQHQSHRPQEGQLQLDRQRNKQQKSRNDHGQGRKRNPKRKQHDPMDIDEVSTARRPQPQQPEPSRQMQQPAHQTQQQLHDPTMKVLKWPFDPLCNPYVPKPQEEAMVQMLLEHNGNRERGMLKDKPQHVVANFVRNMQRLAPSMTLPALCSLRRHHIKLLHPRKTMTQLGLGCIANINASAELFENAIMQFLLSQKISFQTEQKLRKQQAKEHGRTVATPDFTFQQPVLLQMGNAAVPIHWIEVKMYYGASTIPHGGAGAVGTIMATAQKYVHHFGNGAILFMMGCGEGLAIDLQQVGVTALTIDHVGASSINLGPIHEHQRTWCSNEMGEILP